MYNQCKDYKCDYGTCTGITKNMITMVL